MNLAATTNSALTQTVRHVILSNSKVAHVTLPENVDAIEVMADPNTVVHMNGRSYPYGSSPIAMDGGNIPQKVGFSGREGSKVSFKLIHNRTMQPGIAVRTRKLSKRDRR